MRRGELATAATLVEVARATPVAATGSGFTGSGFTPPPVPTFPAGMPERPPILDEPILDGGVYPGGPGGSGPGSPYPTGGGMPVPAGGGSQVPWVMTPSGPAMAPGGVIGERPPAPRAPLVPCSRRNRADGSCAGRATVGGAASGGFVAPPGGLIGGAPVGRGGHAGRWRGCGARGTAAGRR